MSVQAGFKKIFESDKTFGAYYAAERWCTDQGISYGSSCAGSPQGLLFGNYQIAKWRGLTAKERQQLHGTIQGNLRNGPVTVFIKPKFVHLLNV
jgi:hypothetical protein